MKQNEKREIRDELQTIDVEGDLECTIKSLQKTMKDYKKKGYIKFSVEKEKEYDYGYPDGWECLRLSGTRLETDDELAKRIADNKKRSKAAKLAAKTKAIKKEERDRKQYIKLHAKYKGKV